MWPDFSACLNPSKERIINGKPVPQGPAEWCWGECGARQIVRGEAGTSLGHPHEAGVGIIFQESLYPEDGLIVESVVSGGPADIFGGIKKGMALIFINEVDIRGLQSDQIAPLILGPHNSEVKLVFRLDEGYETSVKLNRTLRIKARADV